MYIRWNQNQLTRQKCHGNLKNTNKKNPWETIDTNTYIMTFNTHKIPKEIKIGYKKINVEPYIPNPLRCYKCQRFGLHQDQYMWSPVCRRCREYDMHNNCQKDHKCANCQGKHGASSWDWDMEERKRDYQTKTYSKYHLSRSEKDVRNYKIRGSDKKSQQTKLACKTNAATKLKVVAQVVNKMRALIQEMKTVIEAVTEKLSKDLNTRVATSREGQAKPDKKSSGALTSVVISVAGALQTTPKRKTKGTPHPSRQRRGTKQEKNRSNLRMRTTSRKDRFKLMETEASICRTGKIQMNITKNEKPGSSFKMSSRTKWPTRIKHCNAQGSTKEEPIVEKVWIAI